jgi:hypothetical protein
MLCCLIGGLLAAAMVRAARRRRAHNPLLAVAFGFGAGALAVELVISALVPFGNVKAPGSLAARLLLLAAPAAIAVAAGLAGAAGSLLSRGGVMTVAAGAIAGAIAAEGFDLHVFGLHSDVGLAVVALHAPAFLFFAGGLLLRSKLPDAVTALASYECGGEGMPRNVTS